MSRFDKLASQWDLKPARVESALKTTRKIKSLIDIKDKDILDYGSGTGLVSFDFFEEARSIVAMDNSQGMLEALNRKTTEANISNISTTLHDANSDKLPKKVFDLIVTAMTLHHIKEPENFIQNASDALRTGGHLAISDLESEDGTFHSMGNDDVEHFGFDKEQIRTFFEEAGLEMVYLETNETINKHRDFNIFLAIGKHV
jgi:2-polyprenyl-3-methyl-5-hydroxy-6-metoxy-1,4-benzoquinol methylase